MGACSGGGNPQLSAAEDALENQNYEQALQQVNTAIEQDTANTLARARLVKARILRGMADSTTPPDRYKEMYAEAREMEEEAVSMNPSLRSEVQGQKQLGYIQQMQGGIDAFNTGNQTGDSTTFVRAAAYFHAARQLEPDSASPYLNEAFALLNAGQRPEVIAPLETYVQKTDSVAPNTYQILGQLYLTNDQMEDGIQLLESATEEYPDNDELSSLLLNAYQQSGNTEQAMERYRREIERDPENPTYRYNYGSLLLNADRFDEAIEQLQQAAELDPDNVKAHYNLGAAYVNKGVAVNDSIGSFQQQLDEKESPTQEDKQKLQSMVNERRQIFMDAVPPLEEAQELAGPNNSYRQDICSALFTAYAQTEQMEKAEEVSECAGQSMPGNGGGN
jgi:tetratricopeptide (TPR) repeat protein